VDYYSTYLDETGTEGEIEILDVIEPDIELREPIKPVFTNAFPEPVAEAIVKPRRSTESQLTDEPSLGYTNKWLSENKKDDESITEFRLRLEKEDRENPEQREKDIKLSHFGELLKKQGDSVKLPDWYLDLLEEEKKVKADKEEQAEADKAELERMLEGSRGHVCPNCEMNFVENEGDICDSCKAAEGQFDDDDDDDDDDKVSNPGSAPVEPLEPDTVDQPTEPSTVTDPGPAPDVIDDPGPAPDIVGDPGPAPDRDDYFICAGEGYDDDSYDDDKANWDQEVIDRADYLTAKGIWDLDVINYARYLEDYSAWETEEAAYQEYLVEYAAWETAYDQYLSDLVEWNSAKTTYDEYISSRT
jgi:hypothetical protein